MKSKIKLSENHTRVVSVILKIIEEKIDGIAELLNKNKNVNSYKIINDIDKTESGIKLNTIKHIKKIIEEIYNKYDLRKENQYISKIIESRKASLWSLLNDAYANKLNNYGRFDNNFASEYDELITKLMKEVNKL
jgi:hypothetical protein